MKSIAVVVLLGSILLSGCAALDRTSLSSLDPVRVESGEPIYRFKATADTGYYDLESQEGEKYRMQWLRTWLDDNGHEGQPYEILSRTPVVRSKSLFGKVYDVFYDVKVGKSPKKD